MIKFSIHRTGLGSEHPYCDTVQIVMFILFITVWGLDSFILNYSIHLGGLIPLPLRLFLAILAVCSGAYLAVKSHDFIFSGQSKFFDIGVYSWVRHPMYLGILLVYLGFFFAIPSLLSLAVWIILFLFYDKMTTYEEKDLTRILGEEYITYQKRVPKWFPKIKFKR